MTEVVNLKGEPVDVTTTTSPEIMELIEALRSVAAGEKHLAVGMFLIDAQGRMWTNFRLEAGADINAVAAVTILKHRIVLAFEAAKR